MKKKMHLNPAFIKDNGEKANADITIPNSLESKSCRDSTARNQPKKTDISMKKSISLFSCTASMVAVTGHSAIFMSPAPILENTGSVGLSLVVWLVGGLINLSVALCYAELATVFPKAGGPYAYVSAVFGSFLGFFILWGYVVLIAGPFWAFLAKTAAVYVTKPFFPDCDPPGLAVNLLAAWIIVSLVALNCVYMKYVTRAQTLLSSTKVIALLIIIIGGMVKLAQGETENISEPFANSTREPGGVAMSIFFAIFSYGGWQVMTIMVEEMKCPGRDLPRAVYITFTVIIVKYMLGNLAYYVLASVNDIIASSAVAVLFIGRLFSPLTALISILVATTSIGALNASVMGHSRLLFAAARAGHMPVILGMIHPKYLTPWSAIFVLSVWSLAILFTGSITLTIEFISLFSTIMNLTVVVALLYYRWKKPSVPRPYKVVVSLAVLVLAIHHKPSSIGLGLAILFACIPVYWFGVMWNHKPRSFTDAVECLTTTAQKALHVRKTS